MKLNVLLVSAAAAIIFASCGGAEEPVAVTEPEAPAEPEVTAATYNVNSESSVLNWKGEKLGMYDHSGVITISGGSISTEGDAITAGNFTVDMATMMETGAEDEEKAAQLVGHLSSADFFDVATFPTSTFEITEVMMGDGGAGKIKGNLTIKGKSNGIEFPATLAVTDGQVTANAEFTIDRTQWDVVYGSGVAGAVGDQVISDDITFTVALVADKAN